MRNPLKREYVQLAHVFDSKKHTPAGWYVSEKLDGQRAWWDGGISRGLPASEVPYANTVKDARYVNQVIATGLWSRYGNVIHAPDWFLDQLPKYCLDGELWSGRNNFQKTASIIKDLIPGDGWDTIKYMIFDMPWVTTLFNDGDISVQNYKVYLRGCQQWTKGVYDPRCIDFEAVYKYLEINLKQTDNLIVHRQLRLPFSTPDALEYLYKILDEVTNQGGEGLMLRKPSAWWEPKRSYNILKVKKFQDAEAIVTGYTTGRETEKGSKLLGLMGALITSFNGKRLELSGFTDAERIFNSDKSVTWASTNPGKEVPDWIENLLFPRGSQISFRYRELTDDGIPKEARYWRKSGVH